MFIKTIPLLLFLDVAAITYAAAATCPDGGEIYALGISDEGKAEVIAAHNEKRTMIAKGEVPNQPTSSDMLLQNYDDNLGEEGRVVSLSCKMEHIIATDPRWNWVGQNLYISRSSINSPEQNWTAAVQSWFDENKNFIYPNVTNGGTGHYTQVVWAKSNFVGCDFVSFYDSSKPSYPYTHLYTCNYGPGGNWNHNAPYATGGPCTGEIC